MYTALIIYIYIYIYTFLYICIYVDTDCSFVVRVMYNQEEKKKKKEEETRPALVKSSDVCPNYVVGTLTSNRYHIGLSHHRHVSPNF